MLALQLAIALASSSPSPVPYIAGTPTSGIYEETCVATVFASPGDKLAGGRASFLGRRVRWDDVGVAHRTLPFGAKIEITNLRTGKSTKAWIIDRGPFGRLKNGRWYNGAHFYRGFHRKKLPIPTQMAKVDVDGWIGCTDLTPIVSRRIRHNGKERVMLKVIKWPRRFRKRKHKPNS